MKQLTILLMLLGLLAACGSQTSNVAQNAASGMADNTMADTSHDTMTNETMAGNENEEMAASDSMNEAAMPQSDEMMTNEMSATEVMTDDMSSGEMMTNDMSATEVMADDMSSGEMMADDSVRAAWQQLPLVNARTGETFTLADFAGKTVFVETMATWCTTCRQQLTNVITARGQVDTDQVVFVGLSVETNISADDLASYANNQGFDWLFAIISPEMLQMLADEYGQTITNPPSTPHFIIRPDGSTTELITGIDSSDMLLSEIHAAMQ